MVGNEVAVRESADAIIEIRSLPVMGPWPTLDPFLFCVHHVDKYPPGNGKLGPVTSLEGRNLGQDFSGKNGWSMYHGHRVPGFPRHPHRGFETITVVRSGVIDHADSLGARARYGNGDIQWLTAGDGINHAEMFPLINTGRGNPTDFFQIWLNLPAVDKRVPPHFSMFWAKDVPKLSLEDSAGHKIEVTLIAGEYEKTKALCPPPHSWASSAKSDLAIWIIELEAKAQWKLRGAQPGTVRSLYTLGDGEVQMSGRRVGARNHVELNGAKEVSIVNGNSPIVLLLMQARPIGEPVARYGPFVMNTNAEISEAIRDYRATQFGGWPWDTEDPTHGCSFKRFARHADGRWEEPV